jgi:replicative DNA helicase
MNNRLTWSAASQMVAGLVLTNRVAGDSVNPRYLEAPFDYVVKCKQQKLEDHKIVQEVGYSTYDTCVQAAGAIREGDEVTKYLLILEDIATRVEVGQKLKKKADALLRGEPIAVEDVLPELAKLEERGHEFTTADQFDPEENMWVPTYWQPWDEYFQGMPKYGLILVGAPPGVGKTSLLIKLFDKMTRKKKQVGFFSLELTKEIMLMRWIDINPDVTTAQRKRLIVSDEVYTVDALCVAAARMVADNPDIYAIGIDFADLMVPEDIGEEVGEASKIYRKLATLAKKLRKPIFLLCQLNSSHVGGIPHVNSIRYSRLAEAMAAMIVMGYNPDGIFIDAGKKDKKNPLPYYEGKAYLILGKSRFGFLDGVGAVRIPWLGRGGWGDEAEGWTRL